MAINFPSTAGQATDGSFTHTASGITWAWDGTTWKAQGETSTYVLPQATNTVLGGIKVGANLSVTAGVLSATAVDITWTLGANGTNHYTFTGDGFTSATDDPTLYLIRGKTYKFDNQTSGHPFRIQSDVATSGGGTAYNDGITNNNATGGTGTNLLTFVVPMNAPDTLYYQCTAHTSMTGTIHVLTNQQAIALNDLTDVSTSGVSSGEILKYNGTSWAPAADDSGASALTIKDEGVDKTTTASSIDFVGAGVTATNSGNDVTVTIPGGGGALSSRTTTSGTTASIANDASADLNLTVAKSYSLLKVEVDKAAWVVIYTDAAARTADAARTELQDPTVGSGVIAEVITTAAATQVITPATFGWNNDSTPSTTSYIKVKNKSGSTGTVAVTLTYVQLEG